MRNHVIKKKKSQHLSQHLVNTCFPVSTLDSLTPIFPSQQLPLKADLCTNVKTEALRAVACRDIELLSDRHHIFVALTTCPADTVQTHRACNETMTTHSNQCQMDTHDTRIRAHLAKTGRTGVGVDGADPSANQNHAYVCFASKAVTISALRADCAARRSSFFFRLASIKAITSS